MSLSFFYVANGNHVIMENPNETPEAYIGLGALMIAIDSKGGFQLQPLFPFAEKGVGMVIRKHILYMSSVDDRGIEAAFEGFKKHFAAEKAGIVIPLHN